MLIIKSKKQLNVALKYNDVFKGITNKGHNE